MADKYPQAGDVEGWFAWHREHNPNADEDVRYFDVLCIFESELWCQRSKVRVLRIRKADTLSVEVDRLQRILAFLNQNTMHHRNRTFKQYRDKLLHGRYVYATFNNIPIDNPYDEIEMEILRCEATQ